MTICYACMRMVKGKVFKAFTEKGDQIDLGSSCYERVKKAGADGFQPAMLAVRLFSDRPFKIPECGT